MYGYRLIPRFVLLILMACAAAGAAAASGSPAYFWPAATDAVVFRNGPAYIVRAGEAEAGADGVVTERIPRPILGTLDVYSLTEGVRVKEILAFREENERPAAIREAEEFYRRQIGRRVALFCAEGSRIEGVLRAVLAPGNLLLEGEGEGILVPLAEVKLLRVAGGAVTEAPLVEERPRYRIRLAGRDGRVRLGLSYLEEGWSWFPGCRLNLRGEDRAELVLQATVVNDAEDVEGAALHLVVGSPSFAMRGRLSPMALEAETGTVRAARLASPSADLLEALESYKAAQGTAPPEAEVKITGSMEELFIYEKKGFSLARGQRMQFELYREVIGCETVYKWAMPLPGPGFGGDLLREKIFRDEETGRIWRHLRLKNETEIPWPAAPVMVVSGWQPVSQGLMEYVPAGGSTELALMPAPDIKAAAREEETARKTVRLANRNYLQITVGGTLVLENMKKTTADLEITKELWGEVENAGGGKAARKPDTLQGVNPHSVLEWKLALPPGGKRTIEYLYHFWLAI